MPLVIIEGGLLCEDAFFHLDQLITIPIGAIFKEIDTVIQGLFRLVVMTGDASFFRNHFIFYFVKSFG